MQIDSYFIIVQNYVIGFQVIGKSVVVRLNSGVTYRGVLVIL